MRGQYSGVEILEVLQGAENYNTSLAGLVRQGIQVGDVADFGAGIGTISRKLRSTGYNLIMH